MRDHAAVGIAVAFDLGDLDKIAVGDIDLQLTLCTGRAVQLRQFGGIVRSSGERLIVAKLGGKTDQFLRTLNGAVDERRKSAETLKEMSRFYGRTHSRG